MSKRPAEYLLRFDDLCPTMDRARWARFMPLIERYGLSPILAIVPDNQDPDLDRQSADPEFWQKMRQLDAAGAAIGLHGYSHRCETVGRSLIPLHRQTEFAGVAESLQREWIRAGLARLKAEGLDPRIWVAPRHGFDRATLRALLAEGVDVLSDGFAAEPFQWHGVTWIPQQLWAPEEKSTGLWTICLHANSATEAQVCALERFVDRFAEQFTSVNRVLAEWPRRAPANADRLFHYGLLLRIRLARLRRRLGRG
jgi:predicted deacetylase